MSRRDRLQIEGAQSFHCWRDDGLLAHTRDFRSSAFYESRYCGDTLSHSKGAVHEGVAQTQCDDGVYRRPDHRRLRLDPDRQSGDAAVRHGVDGTCAQAPKWSEVDRSLNRSFPRKRESEADYYTRCAISAL